jgi:hypothetical protein
LPEVPRKGESKRRYLYDLGALTGDVLKVNLVRQELVGIGQNPNMSEELWIGRSARKGLLPELLVLINN